MKKFSILFTLLLAVSLVFSSCVIGTGNKSTKESWDGEKIQIWWDNDADSQNVINTAVSDFEELHPEYKGAFEIVTPKGMDRNALEINIDGGTAPHIVRMDHVYIASLGDKGHLENLLDSKYNFGKYEDKFIPSTWNAVKYKDKIYGIPFDANTIALMYNKELLSKLNIDVDVPANYDDLLEIGNAIKDLNDESLYAIAIPTGEHSSSISDNAGIHWITWLWRMGGDILNEDYTKAKFNEQPGIDALKLYSELIKEHKVAPNTGNAEGLFDKGQVAAIEIGQWKIHLADENPEKFGFTMLPTLKEDLPRHSGLGLFTLGVVSEDAGNKHTKLSYDFALYLGTTSKYQVEFCKKHNFTPSLEEASKDTYFNEGSRKVFLDQIQYAKSKPNVECWPQIEEAINDAIKKVINEDKDIKEALDEAADKVNELLENENKE